MECVQFCIPCAANAAFKIILALSSQALVEKCEGDSLICIGNLLMSFKKLVKNKMANLFQSLSLQ